MTAVPLIRLATLEDVPAILEISNEAARTTSANFAIEPEPLEEWQANYRQTCTTHPWLVASGEDGEIQAFAKASPWKGRCAYTYSVEVTVYVNPKYHRRGIARALYSKLFEILRCQGYCSALAGITLPNHPSVGLHESFGMKRVATFERIGWKFGRWYDVGYWQLHLQSDLSTEPRLRKVLEAVD